MTDRRGERRPGVIEVDEYRFLAGWPLLPDLILQPRARGRRPDLVVDIIRPADLVALTVEGFDVELADSGDTPVLRSAAGEKGKLVVQLAYQHVAERAIYEALAPVPDEKDPGGESTTDDPPTPVDGEAARPEPPIPARPARTSRLVFELGEDDEIPFSINGILEALGRLPMLVHPLAKPRTGITRIPRRGPVLHLPGGLVATETPSGLVVSPAPRGTALPSTATAVGLSALARDGRRIRSILTSRAGTAVRVDTSSGETATVGIGGHIHRVPGLNVGGQLVQPDIVTRIRPRPTFSRPPRQLETAIEAPYRLVISPSARAGWAHAIEPVVAEDAPHRVELWHTRLGVRTEDDGEITVDERKSRQQIVRALWARDREGRDIFDPDEAPDFPDWQALTHPDHQDEPFRSSLDGADRHILVRQSAETWLGVGGKPIPPDPVDVSGLSLSALGAWLDLHGSWDTDPYSDAKIASILLWDHVAPMGRDQYVRVVYPGYLYPFGHKATLVKLTERKMKDASPSVAGLYQRKFLVVGEPLKVFAQPDLPFTDVRISPLVTPTLSGDPDVDTHFIPMVDNQQFRFVLHCWDREGRPVRLVTPLMWVPAGSDHLAAVEDDYRESNIRTVAASGQDIAFAPVLKGGDTMVPTNGLRFDGQAGLTSSIPTLTDATVELPAIENLSPVGEVTIQYSGIYLTHGFGGVQNAGEVWAELPTKADLKFGENGSSGSDKAGGFLQPNLPIGGLSRIKGMVSEVADVATGDFDPIALLGSFAPKLFGIVELVDLLDALGVDLDDVPDVVAETLDRIEGFLADLERAKKMSEGAVAEAERLVTRAQTKAVELQADALQALQEAQQLQVTVTSAVDDVLDELQDLIGAGEAEIAAALQNPLQALRDATLAMEQVAPQLPPLIRQQLLRLAGVLRTVTDAADLVEEMMRFLNGLATGGVQVTFRYEWVPKLKPWPDPPVGPILDVDERSLVLSVEGRAGTDAMNVETLAELKDFTLHLLPGEPLVRFKFDHLSFRAGSAGKPDVDVVLQEIEFVGMLAFVETLKTLIPLDGFSDPPFLDVSEDGLAAGFTLALPNVAVGVFNLSNMSLGADVQVPFLGKAVTVGFNFCTRERPFTLAVVFIGGGGWFLIRLSPDGLDVLELGLEAGAVLALDFGVASGSVSAMLGMYMRLEGDEGSLAGYFRLRGEVDVLGLISASIELYLELHYEFDTGKMVGRAQLTIKVEVLFFSTSVTISAERRFAGSAGDPNFADVMVLPDGSAPAWDEYCLAFAGE